MAPIRREQQEAEDQPPPSRQASISVVLTHQVAAPSVAPITVHRATLPGLVQAQTQAEVDRPQLVYLVPREPWTAERSCQAGPVACLAMQSNV